MRNLLDWKFWFNMRPDMPQGINQKIFIGFVILLALAAVVLFFVKGSARAGMYRKGLAAAFSFCLANAFIGLVLLFFSFELIPFLSARFWLLLWVLSMLAWLGFIARSLARIPELKAQVEAEKNFKKYLPR